MGFMVLAGQSHILTCNYGRPRPEGIISEMMGKHAIRRSGDPFTMVETVERNDKYHDE